MIFGPIFGVLFIIFCDWIIDFAIRKIFKVESLNYTDKNVFYDQTSNRCNIMAGLIIERCDEQAIREIF